MQLERPCDWRRFTLESKGLVCCRGFWKVNKELTIVSSKKIKVKWSRYRPGVAQRVGRDIALLFHDRGTRRGWVVNSTPRPHFTPGKTRYPLYRRLGGPQGRSGRAENLVPTGIRSPTVQPLFSRYTDWATGPTLWQPIVAKVQGDAGQYFGRWHYRPLWEKKSSWEYVSNSEWLPRYSCLILQVLKHCDWW